MIKTKKVLLEVPVDLLEGIKIFAKREGRSMSAQLIYDFKRQEKYLNCIPKEFNYNQVESDTLIACTPYGLQQTDIKAPPAVVNRFFLKKDEFNKDVFDVDFFTIDGIKKLLQENYATKQEFYKYLKIKAVEINILKETIADLERWKGEQPDVDLIIDDMINFLKS